MTTAGEKGHSFVPCTNRALNCSFPIAVLESVVGAPVEDDLAVLLRAEVVREVRRFPQPGAGRGRG